MFSSKHLGDLERGGPAVEMALVLPLLLFVLFGLIDFGRAYNAQIQLSAAAREGVRLASLNTSGDASGSATVNPYGDAAIKARIESSAIGLGTFTAAGGATVPVDCPTPNSACIKYCPTSVGSGDYATVVLTAKFTWITGISSMSKLLPGAGSASFTTPDHITTVGVMRCTG